MRKYLILLFVILNSYFAFAQKDSIKQDMTFDFGITRGKNVYLWPIIKKNKNDKEKDLQIAFTLLQNKRDYVEHSKHFHILPIIWKDSTPQSNDLRLFSTYYPSVIRFYKENNKQLKSFRLLEIAPEINALEITKNQDGTFLKNNLFFFLWSKNDVISGKSYFVLFPIFWHYNYPKYNTTSLLPLFYYHKQKRLDESILTVTPLFWKTKSETTSQTLLLPLFYHLKYRNGSSFKIKTSLYPIYFRNFSNKANNTTILPIWWKFENRRYKSFTLFPLFSYGKSKDTIRMGKHLALTPFYLKYTEKENYKFRMIFPIWFNAKNLSYENNLILPVYWFSHKGSSYYEKTNRHIFPFYFYYKSYYKENYSIFPIVWRFKSDHYKSFTLFPLFSTGISKDSTKKHFAITAFYWHYRSKNKVRDILLPIWWKTKYQYPKDTSYTNVVFPFYWHSKEKEKSYDVFFPIYWRYKKPWYQSITIMPFFSKGHNPTKESRHIAVTALYWKFVEPRNTFQFLFPVFWKNNSYYSYDTSSFTTLFPIYWRYINHDKFYTHVFPIFYKYKDKYKRYIHVVPFYSSSYDSLLNKRKKMISLVYWNYQRTWHYRNDTIKSNSTFVFPIWFNHKEKYYFTDIKTTTKFQVLFPLYFRIKDGDLNFRSYFPIYFYNDKRKYKTLTVFPIFSKGKSPDNDINHLIVTPLYWHYEKFGAKRTLMLPLFNTYNDNFKTKKVNILGFLFRYKKIDFLKRTDIVFPFIRNISDSNYKYFHLAPIIWYSHSDKKSMFSIQPVYYQSKNDSTSYYQFCWQLFTYKKHINQYKSYNILWKLMNYKRFTNHDHEFRLVHLLFATIDKNKTKEYSLFPFYYYSKDDNNNKSLSLFFSFYSKFQRKIKNSNEFYKEQKIFWFLRIRSNYNSLKERGIINSRKDLK